MEELPLIISKLNTNKKKVHGKLANCFLQMTKQSRKSKQRVRLGRHYILKIQ